MSALDYLPPTVTSMNLLVKESLCIWQALRELGFNEDNLELVFIQPEKEPDWNYMAVRVKEFDKIATISAGRFDCRYTPEELQEEFLARLSDLDAGKIRDFKQLQRTSKMVDKDRWQVAFRKLGMAAYGPRLRD